ncbi:MAG: hypothetical protein RLY14_1862, partial [Planctomycetota bacterium]
MGSYERRQVIGWKATDRRYRKQRRVRQSRVFRPAIEILENRVLLAFSVTTAELYSRSGLRLVADFDQPVNVASVQANDLVLNGAQVATSVIVVDADTVEFLLPTLGDGTHVATIAANAILDSSGSGLTAFSNSYIVANNAQLAVKHNPRLQPGNSPLVGFAGGEKDRVDVLWQTIPGGTGTQDSFLVQYRLAGSNDAWQSASANADIVTNVENRIVRSASITGLNWNTVYEYRVRHMRGNVIVATYQHTFNTRLQAGDSTSFSFAAYGDSASGAATGFRQVQSRINQVDPAFAVLLGDNVYSSGSHQESDARFDPVVNPEAAAWMASHIDYLGLGNHDVGTGSGLPTEQNYSVPIPVAGVTAPAAPTNERDEHNFSWDYGNVHFVTFDTNSLTSTTRLDTLLDWVVADLNASTARWKIVYGHHPLAGVPDKTENPSQNYYQQVVNRLKAAGVDMLMTGHSHTYSWTYPLTGQINGTATYVNHGRNDSFIAGEGLTQLVSGVGGVEIRTGTYSQFPFVAEGFTSATTIPARFGFSKVDVTPNVLTVSYVAADNGAVIDSFTISKDTAPQTVSFQQGTGGYVGTTDTYLHQNTPTTNFATATSLNVDNDDPATTGLDVQALLRFDNLFGSNAGQIPANATLRSATLQIHVTNESINNINLHRMLQPWNATDTWNSRLNGIQIDGVEAVSTPDTSSGQTQLGSMSFNVLRSLQAWQAAPATNLGWALIPTGSDGADFHSSEGTTAPKLIVTYVIDDGANDPPVAVNDVATIVGSTATVISVLSNDSDINGNPLTVTSVTSPTHGTATINADNTVTYTPAIGYFGADSFSYAISDGRGGTASAIVNLTVVATTSFQQGVGGYTGTFDTFLQQNSATTSNAAAVSLNVDSDDPAGTGLDVQTLLRFENLFGDSAGQIPANAILHSATLQLQVTNSGSSMNLHRMLSNWTAIDTWNSTTNGIQNDGVEAVATADLSSGAVSVGMTSLNVLSSLQAWRTAPSTNRGWVLLPTGSDGVDFDSSEGATKPKLIVAYIPVTNIPPTAVNDSVSTNEDTSINISVLANDSDGDGGALTVTSTSTPLHGTASVNANGTITYSPVANYFGTDSFSYWISDGQGGSATATVYLSITSVNDLPLGLPTISGVAEENQVLTVNTSGISDMDGLGTFTYQWLRAGNAVSGATGSSYLLGDADVGATIQVQVRYVDGSGFSEGPLTSLATSSVLNVNDAPTGLPTISGTAVSGQVLSVVTSSIGDADGLGVFNYQWIRGGSPIAGATNSSYLLTDIDVDMVIQVQVNYLDGHGTSEQLLSSGVTVQAQPGIVVTPATLVTRENGSPITFTVALATVPSAEVRIPVSSSDTTEGKLDVSEIVFAAGNRGPVTVTVTPIDDLLSGSLDGSIVYSIVTAPANSSDTNYNGRNASDVMLTNQDDDSPVVSRNYADSAYAGGLIQGSVTGAISDTWQSGLGVQTLKEVSAQV